MHIIGPVTEGIHSGVVFPGLPVVDGPVGARQYTWDTVMVVSCPILARVVFTSLSSSTWHWLTDLVRARSFDPMMKFTIFAPVFVRSIKFWASAMSLPLWSRTDLREYMQDSSMSRPMDDVTMSTSTCVFFLSPVDREGKFRPSLHGRLSLGSCCSWPFVTLTEAVVFDF